MSETNGTKPAPPADAPADDVPVSERIMGAFGLVVAIGLGLIALDLVTGGAVSRMFSTGDDDG